LAVNNNQHKLAILCRHNKWSRVRNILCWTEH